MADEITDSTRENDELGNCYCYHVAYKVEDSGKTNTFCVVVHATDMTDPNDEDEAETLANVQATTKKANWTATFSTAHVNVSASGMEGAVTL